MKAKEIFRHSTRLRAVRSEWFLVGTNCFLLTNVHSDSSNRSTLTQHLAVFPSGQDSPCRFQPLSSTFLTAARRTASACGTASALESSCSRFETEPSASGRPNTRSKKSPIPRLLTCGLPERCPTSAASPRPKRWQVIPPGIFPKAQRADRPQGPGGRIRHRPQLDPPRTRQGPTHAPTRPRPSAVRKFRACENPAN